MYQVDYSIIDNLTDEISSQIEELSLELERANNELTNVSMELKEINLKVQDDTLIHGNDSDIEKPADNMMSPLASRSPFENVENKPSSDLLFQQAEIQAKYDTILNYRDSLNNRIQDKVEVFNNYESIKDVIKKQITDQNNESFVMDLKEVAQKKRLVSLDKIKYAPVVTKSESTFVSPMRNKLKDMMSAIGFVEADPVRGKQELNRVYKEMADIVNDSDRLLSQFAAVEPFTALTVLLNKYINDIKNIYSDVNIKISMSEIESIDKVDSDLNRFIMIIFKGIINSILIKCNPKGVIAKLDYADGYLNIGGLAQGTFYNFYGDIKANPSSMIANIYEKVFLLNGIIGFKDNKDGTFVFQCRLPIKNYL